MKRHFDLLSRIGMSLAVMLLWGNFLLAQRTITGTVTEAESGEPLIGATVSVVNTSRGTVTDIDGKYSIEAPAGANQIKISYTGYAEQVLTIGAGNVLDVALAQGSALDELVVIGYGSVKKKDATGAVVALGTKDFNQGVVVSPEQLMQGRAAGVQIGATSGEPGGGIEIRIRGTSSVRGGNNPLFVVDGVPLAGDDVSASGANASFGSSSPRNPLNFLNPNDIANIDVLKDASATAIYGSRGANGVVLITTKSGQGSGSLDYGYSMGIANITKKYDLLDSRGFIAARNVTGTDPSNGGSSTDWQDEILQTGITHNHNISFGAGSDRGNYRVSFGYQDQDGIIKESGLKKHTLNLNTMNKFIDNRLKIGTQVTVANLRDESAPITNNSGFQGDLLGAALKANPTNPVYGKLVAGKIEADSNFLQIGNDQLNPVAMLAYAIDRTSTLRGMGNIFADFEIVKGLSFRTVLGTDRSISERRAAYSGALTAEGIQGKGRGFTGDVRTENNLWENYFTYSKALGNSNLTALLGYSYQQFNYTTKGVETYGYRVTDPELMINNMNAVDISATGVNMVPSFNGTRQDELQSYFGRVQYDIAGKYYFTGTLRADGSTRFGKDNAYGIFPSFGFKWKLSEEDFVPDMFSDLGLRLGWGRTGNQELPHNRHTTRQSYLDWDIDTGGNPAGGNLDFVTFQNDGLKWESTDQYNAGLDFGFNNNRVFGSLDYYYKSTNDLLFQLRSAQPAPFPFRWENLDATVINTGVELTLGAYPVSTKDFTWNIAFNTAYNNNKVKDLATVVNTGEVNGQGLTGAFAQRIVNDQPLFVFFVRDFRGFNAEGLSVYGDDLSTDGPQVYTGKSPLPNLIGGLTNTFTYKNLDLSFFFTGQFGHYIYNNTANAYFTAGALAGGRNVTANVAGNGEDPVLNAPEASTRFLEKGDFVRLQNLTLGYNIPTGNSKVRGLRLYMNGQNLLTFTNYSGQDPEVSTNKSIDGIPSAGMDYTPYPRARVILFGANVTF